MKRAAVPSILVVVVMLAVGVIAEAQPQAKVSKIGWLSARPASTSGWKICSNCKKTRLSLFVSYVSLIGGISNKPRRLRHQSDSDGIGASAGQVFCHHA